MILFVLPDCLICAVVQQAVEALSQRHRIPLDVRPPEPQVPAVPALYYQNQLYLGEFIPRELSRILSTPEALCPLRPLPTAPD